MRVIGVSTQEMVARVLLPALLPAVPVTFILIALREIVRPSSLISLLLLAAAGSSLYLAGYLSMSANQFERELVRQNIATMIHRARVHFRQV
jgi:hypothetical protein